MYALIVQYDESWSQELETDICEQQACSPKLAHSRVKDIADLIF